MQSKGFGRIKHRREQLEARKDNLSEINRLVDWDIFHNCLEQLPQPKRKSKAGRKPIDRLLLLKLLILQQLYNLSDEELEYQTHDRLSFRRFLGLSADDEVPDSTTLWLFRQSLSDADLIETLFETFNEYLAGCGYTAKGGQIMDATLVPVPIQRNTREENKQIKQGDIPPEWKDKPHKQSHKDTDARWTKKNGKSHFGYKNHINIDAEYGFIRQHQVTDASVHDSQPFCDLLDGENDADEIWADSAYRSEALEAGLEAIGYVSQIHERGYRHHPLTEEQKQTNRGKSKVRAKVEHVFGAWVMNLGGKQVRCIGIKRVRAQLGLKDLAYNVRRYVFWRKKELTLQNQYA
ncbi:IS5 family transposase [Acaryochloris sp. CCMEE 5410]|uniref:IS5 family transposase n=1 Tax=Acaryochloris sp. CCMEE 5410 TaxID=310037 RepID=UPI0002484171|nr:IS5 family transposase [Acaryochloris sp. CCMEE 5410]KAI9129811.1 IS5 family transposase [Acaryochloris sp. CCMEE 5410]